MTFSIKKYFDILERLLGSKGCPWSKSQSISQICHYVIEEAYEVLDAQKRHSGEKVKEELGDLFFTLSFLTNLVLKEHGGTFEEIVERGCNKIVRRSPHVFDDPKEEITFEQLRGQWESIKAKERAAQKENPLESVAPSLPLVLRAMKWVELAHKYGYAEEFNERNLGDAFLSLVYRGANQYENVSHVFEDRLKEFEEGFRSWMENQSTEETKK